MNIKKFGYAVATAFVLAIVIVKWPAIGLFAGIILAFTFGRQRIAFVADRSVKFLQVFLVALGVAMVTQAVLTLAFGASFEALANNHGLLAAMRDTSLIGEAIFKEMLALLVIISVTYLFVTAEKPQKWVFKLLGGLALVCLCLNAWDAYAPLHSGIKAQRRQTVLVLRQAVASYFTTNANIAAKTTQLSAVANEISASNAGMIAVKGDVKRIYLAHYDSASGSFKDITILAGRELAAGAKVRLTNKPMASYQDQFFVNCRLPQADGSYICPPEMEEQESNIWLEAEALDLSKLSQSKPAVVKEPVSALAKAEKKPVEMEPLAPPDEELQTSLASPQEKLVKFKAGQRTLTGLMVKRGDFIRYSGATAAFQVESKAAGGFRRVVSDESFIGNENGELDLYGLDRDGQVHIRVVSQAKPPVQEATVHFKAGQKVGAGLTVEPGDQVAFSGLTAPFKVENADKSAFHAVEQPGTFTANGSGEIELFGLDRDGQVHIRVVSQR